MAYPSSVKQIEDRIVALAAAHPTICTRVELPHRTYEGGTAAAPGRKVAYLRIGTGTGGGRPRILIVAGVHAREWAPPDAVLTFVERLLVAYDSKGKKPFTYDPFVDERSPPKVLFKAFDIKAADVKKIVERTELYVLPLVNPDGRAHSMHPSKANVGWRKNRRPAPPNTTCPPLAVQISPTDWKFVPQDPAGVDLNRNFDIAWDIDKYYSTAAAGGVSAYLNPCSEVYHGPKPYTPEPETRNVQGLLNDKNIDFYLDVHSAAGKFLFAWGMEENQETDPQKTFKSPTHDRRADGTGGRDSVATTYAEWMPPGAEKAHRNLGGRMENAILDSTGYTAKDTKTDPDAAKARSRSQYSTVQSTALFGGFDRSTGVSRDYAFSRQIGSLPGPTVVATAARPLVYSYTFECGRDVDGGFWPDAAKEYPKIEREVGAGLNAFLTFAATWVAPVAPPQQPQPPPPQQPQPQVQPQSESATSATEGGGCFAMVVPSFLAGLAIVAVAVAAAGALVGAARRSLGGS